MHDLLMNHGGASWLLPSVTAAMAVGPQRAIRRRERARGSIRTIHAVADACHGAPSFFRPDQRTEGAASMEGIGQMDGRALALADASSEQRGKKHAGK